MNHRKNSITGKLAKYLATGPKEGAKDIAKKFGVSVPYVYTLRSVMKKAASKVAPQASKKKKPETIPLPTPDDNKMYSYRWVNTNVFSEAQKDAIAEQLASNDMVNHPPHYKTGGIETIDFIEAKGLNYHLGNVVKYVARADHKGDRLENLMKAEWYLRREIENVRGARHEAN